MNPFKVGDKVTNSCFADLIGKVFVITEVSGNAAAIEGDLGNHKVKWFDIGWLTPVPVCKHCGLPVVEKPHGTNMAWYHEVGKTLFRTCKYALECAGKSSWVMFTPEAVAEEGKF